MAEEQQKKKRSTLQVKLPSNQVFPLVAISTAHKFNKEQMTEHLKKALQFGYRHINCSRNNGNQVIVGEAINQCIRDNRVKRSQIFISTKTFNHVNKNPVTQLKQALKLMNIEYVDMYSLEFPFIGLDNQGQWTHRQVEDLWKDMEQCVLKGYAKNLGVCNFSGQMIQSLISEAKIKPICNQIQIHPYLVELGIIDICQKNNISVVAIDPLCSSSKREDCVISKQELLQQLSTKYNRSISQIVLKWLFSKDVGATIQSSSYQTMKQLYDSWNFDLGEEDSKKIKSLNKGYRVREYRQYFKDEFTPFE